MRVDPNAIRSCAICDLLELRTAPQRPRPPRGAFILTEVEFAAFFRGLRVGGGFTFRSLLGKVSEGRMGCGKRETAGDGIRAVILDV
jgi:hypothetical protein